MRLFAASVWFALTQGKYSGILFDGVLFAVAVRDFIFLFHLLPPAITFLNESRCGSTGHSGGKTPCSWSLYKR
jgi:hypothetical protein